MNVLLIGPRATGKTTLGRAIALATQRDFVDLDDAVLGRFGQNSICEVWAQHGEAAFREAECTTLAELLQKNHQVIALGGGTVMIDKARQEIREAQCAGHAVVIYIHTPADILKSRLTNEPGDRPSLKGSEPALEIEEVLIEREPTFLELANFVAHTHNRSVHAVVEQIVGILDEASQVE